MKAANFSQFFYVRYFHFILLYSGIVLHKATTNKKIWESAFVRTYFYLVDWENWKVPEKKLNWKEFL